MRTKMNIKAGGKRLNHNETLVTHGGRLQEGANNPGGAVTSPYAVPELLLASLKAGAPSCQQTRNSSRARDWQLGPRVQPN